METSTTRIKNSTSKLGRNPLAHKKPGLPETGKVLRTKPLHHESKTSQQAHFQNKSKEHESTTTQNTKPFHPVLRALIFAFASSIAMRDWLVEITRS